MKQLLTEKQVEEMLLNNGKDCEDFFEYADNLEVIIDGIEHWDEGLVKRYINR